MPSWGRNIWLLRHMHVRRQPRAHRGIPHHHDLRRRPDVSISMTRRLSWRLHHGRDSQARPSRGVCILDTAVPTTNKRVEMSKQERHASLGSAHLVHGCCHGRSSLVYAQRGLVVVSRDHAHLYKSREARWTMRVAATLIGNSVCCIV
jgi:hypothetical protein